MSFRCWKSNAPVKRRNLSCPIIVQFAARRCSVRKAKRPTVASVFLVLRSSRRVSSSSVRAAPWTSIDVHGAARTEELETLLELRRTRNTDATVGRFAFLTEHRRAANWTMIGHDKFLLLTGALLFQHLNDIRNHVAGSLHHGHIADADVLAFDLVHVVKRGA